MIKIIITVTIIITNYKTSLSSVFSLIPIKWKG